MATVVNFIDVTLQAAAARGVNLPTADIQLLPSAPLFKVAPDGSITPPAITFTATLIDLEAELTFNATGAPMTSPTARSVTIVGESMTGSSVTVIASATVNGRTYTKPCTISKVQDGTVGSTTYTWIKYADSAAGAGLSDDPAGKIYIGLAYNKTSPIESIIASDYTWSLIKGEDGVPGQPGKDGVQLFTWIKYSNSADGAGLYDQPTADTLYIGIAVNKTTATESSSPADYVWSRFKGDQGVPGPALYTWIKYADSAAGAGLSDDPTDKAYIGFAYNKTTAVESENPADYAWSLNQGGQGVPGQPGKDGVTLYTWIKYSDAPDGTGLYDVPTDSTAYIGIAVNKATAIESTNKADYTWSRFKGGQGVPGNPGQPGQRGTVDISAGTAGTVWSDSEATAAIAQTGYGVPQMLDAVTLYNQEAGFANTRYWNGSAWVPVSQVINGSLLVKNTVAADKIDTRGLSIKDAAGNVILAAGSALSAEYAAPGTKNSDIAVGGRNLAEDSAFEGRLRPWTQKSGNVGACFIEGAPGAKNLFMDGAGDVYVDGQGPGIPVTPGQQYVFSIDYGTATSGQITGSSTHFYTNSGDTVFLPFNPLNTNSARTRWTSDPWTCPGDVTSLSPRFGFQATAYSWMRVYKFDVQKGNKAADWSPAPEDLRAASDAAATAASNAQAQADSAMRRVDNISADGVLDRSEKGDAEVEFQRIHDEHTGIVTESNRLGISYADWEARFYELWGYLGAIPGWGDHNSDSVIDRSSYNTRFGNYYAARQALLNSFTAKNKAIADAAANTSTWDGTNGKPDDALNLILKSNFDDGTLGKWTGRWAAAVSGMPFKMAMSVVGRDTNENNLIQVTPGEKLTCSAYLSSAGANVPMKFGVEYRRADGSNLQFWDAPASNVIAPFVGWTPVSGEVVVPQDAAYAIPWVQLDGPSGSNMGEGFVARPRITRFQPGATVGAPPGTMVGGTDAGLVASRALNGDSAYNALPGINAQVDARLRKDGHDTITGSIGLMSKLALLIGDENNGVWIGSEGIVLVQGGVIKVTIPISGNPTFAGQLIAAMGTLGSLTLAPGGNIRSANHNGTFGYWPPKGGGNVMYLGAEGFQLGNYNEGFYIHAYANGNWYMPGFAMVAGQLTLTKPVLVEPQLNNPSISTEFYASLADVYMTGQSGTVTIDIYPTFNYGSGNYSFQWILTSGGPSYTQLTSAGDSHMKFQITGGNSGWRTGSVSVFVKDLTTGATSVTECSINVGFGNSVPP